MLRIKLSDLLGKHKMNQKTLATATKIRPATISKMYYEEIKRLDVKHIESICKTFNCTVQDLLEYIPDDTETSTKEEKQTSDITN